MHSKDLRSILPLHTLRASRGHRLSATSLSATSRLAAIVGRALGVGRTAPSIEALEERKLLEGSFDSPILLGAPDPAGVIVQAGAITNATPSTNNDTYSFTAPASGFITLLADTANEAPASTLNTRIEVYNSARQLITSGTTNGVLTSGTANDGWAGFVATNGEQYFVVVNNENATSGTYALRVRTANQTFDMGGEQPSELGVGRETGSPTPDLGAFPPVLPAAILGQLGGTGDIATRLRQDEIVYRWTVPTGNAYNSLTTINAQSTIANQTRRLDTRLDIYNAQGQLVLSDSDTGRINDAFLSLRTNPGETYFIRVRSDEIRNQNIELATGPMFLVIDASAQELTIDDMSRRGADQNGEFLGFDDPSVAPNPAAPTPVFQTASYSFVAQGSGLAIIVASDRGLAPVTDPALRLYDDAGTLIDFRDNTVDLIPQLAVQLEGGRRYFVVVDGFAVQNQTQFNLFIEANHTLGSGVDDHVDPPEGTLTADEAVRRFAQATALPWDQQAYVTLDGHDGQLTGLGTLVPAEVALQNNLRIERDRGLRVVATGQGRLEGGIDRDLFTFTPPADMLMDFDGNNNDAGTSLFIGGEFQVGQVGSTFDVFSPGLITFDADDFWAVGPQFEQDPVRFGFNDFAGTPATNGPIIHAIQSFPLIVNGVPTNFMFVGGDFTLTVPTNQGPVNVDNFAIYSFNTQQRRWEFLPAGGADGPVFAFKPWDVPGLDDQPNLFIGGDFQTILGAPANRLARLDENGALAAVGVGVAGPIRAMEIFEPFIETEPDSFESQGERLYIGGSFTNIGPGGVNDAFTNLTALDEDGNFVQVGALGSAPVNGPVFALATHRPFGEDVEDSDTRLVVGGQFTSMSGVATANIGLYQSEAAAPQTFGAGLDGPVFALNRWDPPNINNAPDTDPNLAPGIIVGGDFTNGAGNNLVLADFPAGGQGQFFQMFGGFLGTDGPVRAITNFVDAEEPGVDETLISGTPQAVLYIGGDFTTIDTGLVTVNAVGVAQLAAFNANPPITPDAFRWTALSGGLGNRVGNDPIRVHALGAFDDGNASRWDRHSRPETTLAVTVSPDFGSFINARVRIYDSNFNIVYGFDTLGSDTIAPPFPDPAGMIDRSLTAGGTAASQDFDGIKVFGGETYYLEVSSYVGNDDATAQPSGTTGRYTVTVIADAGPVDVNNDGFREDVNMTAVAEETNSGLPAQAIQVTSTLGTGEGAGDRNTSTVFPFVGNTTSNMKTEPSTLQAFSLRGDQGLIDNINDTDLYFFRAEETGFVELRVQTVDYTDRYAQVVGTTLVNGVEKTLSSRLDAAIRAFDNDLEQIAYNDNNGVIGAQLADFTIGDTDLQYVGNFGGQTTFVEFRKQDPRVVIPVIAGQVYYFQVESAQRWMNPEAPLPPDAGDPDNPLRRIATPLSEIDWRDATGGYRVLLNQVGEQATDFENGQFVKDDYSNVGGQGTVIPLGASGTATATGVINNTPVNPNDIDIMQVLVPASGQMTISANVTSGNLIVTGFVIDIDGNVLANLTPAGGTLYSATFFAAQGQFLQVVIQGSGVTEGGYTVNFASQPLVDDYADANKWFLAEELRLIDFRGRVEANGVINSLYDTDVFKFDFDSFQRATFTVRSLTPTLTPRVTVYEVSETTTGEAIFLRIGTGVAAQAGGTATAFASLQPERIVEVQAPGENRPYPFYYVVVEGADPQLHFGGYSFEAQFVATDDHPDGDTDGDTLFDTGDFAVASVVTLDLIEGTGASAGNLEVETDSDLFSFVAQATGTSTLTLTRATGSFVRGRITVLSSTGVQLAQASMDDLSNVTPLTLDLAVTRGDTLFVVVDSIAPNASTTRTGAYELSVRAPVIDDHPNAGEFDIATAIILSGATGRGQVGGDTGGISGNPRISPDGDSDLFTFSTLLAGNQRVTVTPFNTPLGVLAPRMQIFRASDLVTPIATIDAVGPESEVSFTILNATAGERFYILVSALVNDTLTGETPRGEYNVLVQGPTPDNPVDPIDPSTIDFDAPTVLFISPRTGEGSSLTTLSNPQVSEIAPATDRDLYSFTAAGTGRVNVRLWLPEGSLLDAAITILRDDGNGQRTQIAFDADGIAGSTAFTSFGAFAGQRYFVIVDGLGTSTGSYVLEVGTAPLVNRLVYPEGFTSDSVFEFVPLVNPNPFPLNYTVRLRYESGDLETVFPTRTIAGNARDGFTITEGTISRAAGVRPGVGYAIVVDWALPDSLVGIDPATIQPLGATLSHYDFGSSTGDAFTSKVSSTWSFARVERDPGSTLDFVLFYNPQTYAVDVTLTAYFSDGTRLSLPTRQVEGGRRSGFGINDFPELGRGIFGVTLTATPAPQITTAQLLVEPFEGIVASLTHYDVTGNQSAFAVIGDTSNGSRAGVISRFEQGNGISSEITFFNPGVDRVTVTLTGSYQRANLPSFNRTIDVPAGRTVTLTGTQLGLLSNQPVGLRYSATGNVVVNSQTDTLGDADSSTSITAAGQRFLFGDAYINANTAGRLYFETLNFFNPATTAITVSVNLYFFNRPNQPELGNANPAQRTISVNVPARGFAELKLHERAEVITNLGANNSPDIFFGIEALSTSPFTASFTHYDLFLGGGWGAVGVPVGLTTPLNQIIRS